MPLDSSERGDASDNSLGLRRGAIEKEDRLAVLAAAALSERQESDGWFGALGRRPATWLLAVLVAIAGIGLFVPIEVTVAANGQFLPAIRPRNIVAPFAGEVVNVFVEPHARVRSGEALVQVVPLELDAGLPLHERNLSDYRDRLVVVETLLGRLELVRGGSAPPAIIEATDELGELWSALRAIEAQRTAYFSLRRQLTSRVGVQADLQTQDEVARQRREQLIEKGLLPNAARDDLERARKTAQADALSMNAQVDQTSATIASLSAQRAELLGRAFTQLESERKSLEDRVRQSVVSRNRAALIDRASMVRAPFAGVIDELNAPVVGQSVGAGDIFYHIAPIGDDHRVELVVSNRDAASIAVGDPVRVYPAAIATDSFQFVEGRVTVVGATATQPLPSLDAGTMAAAGYLVEVKLNNPPLQLSRHIRHGLACRAVIITSQRTAGDYLLRSFLGRLRAPFSDV